jgi:TonB family protein
MVNVLCRWSGTLAVTAVALALASPAVASGQPGAGFHLQQGPPTPPPQGQRITASDGDTVIVAPRAIGNYVIGNRPRVRKVHHVDPVKPPQAQSAGASGVVILQITVAADGTVTNAKVLRSIPPLDQAALDAVRQWRYEPFMAEGRAVPILLTVTVPF